MKMIWPLQYDLTVLSLTDAELYSWEENFAGSSGLADPKPSPLIIQQAKSEVSND
jgi:hypothetical protein